MTFPDPRAQFLRNRVMTATPAQRVVMLYDRLNLDLNLAQGATDLATSGGYLGHAMEIVAELRSSLDITAGGPAANLASIYAYLLNELIAVRGGAVERVDGLREIVSSLRAAWAQVAEAANSEPKTLKQAAGAWVG